ncbi:Outer membrane protein (porin) [Succinivibrio dextrinosolvens]|uniref:porin n=1 Tax=Succinivibrio dextrinosolvens TaxID=83771 RepID=UPI0008E98415|nr:hypothetical protein [Succinivibrio dextrinosolvens]SFS75409.1 Outer membrane protein (porin) [Succinivibrio dextrinosolvens]
MNSARVNIAGKSQLTDWVAGIGFAEWDAADGQEHDVFSARDQYVGADFCDYGELVAGRFVDSTYSVEAATDLYEDAAGSVQGKLNAERRGGQLMYTFDNNGFFAQAGVQTAQNNAALIDNQYFFDEDSYAIDSGYNGVLGYTFEDVVFGPLAFKAGYSYVKGQTNDDLGEPAVDDAGELITGVYANGNAFENFKHANASIAWGNFESGFYVAALFDRAVLNTKYDRKTNYGYELAAGYAFDNGVSVLAGYETSYYYTKTAGEESKYNKAIVRRIPVFVNYTVNENFNVWTEAGFNAGSSASAEEFVNEAAREALFSVGARYTF